MLAGSRVLVRLGILWLHSRLWCGVYSTNSKLFHVWFHFSPFLVLGSFSLLTETLFSLFRFVASESCCVIPPPAVIVWVSLFLLLFFLLFFQFSLWDSYPILPVFWIHIQTSLSPSCSIVPFHHHSGSPRVLRFRSLGFFPFVSGPFLPLSSSFSGFLQSKSRLPLSRSSPFFHTPPLLLLFAPILIQSVI